MYRKALFFVFYFFLVFSTLANSINLIPKPAKITIYWDSSLSMKEKDLAKEMNASRMYEEKTQGFNTEEFLLINAEKGEWLINIESNIKNDKNPVVVKYTVFKNFGKANETRESKVLLLNNIKGKHILGKVRI